VVFAVAFYWFYSFATEKALARIQEDLVDTLNGTAAGLNGDDLIALYQEGVPNADGFSDDPRFQQEMDWLDTVHSIEPRAWPYTYVKGEGENEIIWIADLWARYDPSKAVKFQELYTSEGTLIKSLTEQTLKMEPYSDEWGAWVSAYTPLKNSKGELVGALGLDFRADYVFQVQQAILDRVVLAFAITYVSLLVLVFLISSAFTAPIIALTRAAERIGEGDYDQNLADINKARFRDEIGILTDVFSGMVDKVYQREQSLRKQVAELKIEIDETKRQQQVSEIVDSDFFQDLQNKARQIRSRRSQTSPTDSSPNDSTS
jgi:methyl-accepting chemotaxis protein